MVTIISDLDSERKRKSQDSAEKIKYYSFVSQLLVSPLGSWDEFIVGH